MCTKGFLHLQSLIRGQCHQCEEEEERHQSDWALRHLDPGNLLRGHRRFLGHFHQGWKPASRDCGANHPIWILLCTPHTDQNNAKH